MNAGQGVEVLPDVFLLGFHSILDYEAGVGEGDDLLEEVMLRIQEREDGRIARSEAEANICVDPKGQLGSQAFENEGFGTFEKFRRIIVIIVDAAAGALSGETQRTE
jgi:hypothetical protein